MSRYAIRSSLAALSFVVAAGGLAGAAVAAPGMGGMDGMGQAHGKYHGHHRGMMMRDGFRVPGIGPLSQKQVDALKLDAKQQAAFDAARQAQRDLHTAMREAGAKRHELLASQLEGGKLDPRALVARHDENRDQFSKQAEQVREKWLAAWDSLNDGQRQQVTEIVKERHAKMQERRAKMQERRANREERQGRGAGQAQAPASGAAQSN
ncbi:hypothetical protein [Bordetella genomosp. 2]|uniref:Uncharacterized protein n=1 Tax=Bordetella genomosp. 2 TaxID=1983456 RepID=A0A261VQ21_9BORD|nr:hypothetical protein [Bordetella genomosp. 2]OZI75957.1 hypothetical protein CAL24_12240 [Bordetella genomosp. 2]